MGCVNSTPVIDQNVVIPPPDVPKVALLETENDLLFKDDNGELFVKKEFWDKAIEQGEGVVDIVFGLSQASFDLVEIGREVWKTLSDAISPQSLDTLFKTALLTFMDENSTDMFMDTCQKQEWMKQFVKMCCLVLIGSKAVLDQKQNCKKLASLVKAILKNFALVSVENLKQLCQAEDFVHLRTAFDTYLLLSISLIARFIKRSNFVTFLLRTKDADNFFDVFVGLISTLDLANTQLFHLSGLDFESEKDVNFAQFYNEERLQIEKLLAELGEEDIAKGLKAIFDQHNGDDNPAAEKVLGEIRKIISGLPVDLEFPTQMAKLLSKLMSDIFPARLSLQVRKFWNDFIGGDKADVDWKTFCEIVENGHRTFLTSEEVRNKEAEHTDSDSSLMRFIAKNKLDKNDNGKVEVSELNALQQWCIQQWEKEPKNQRTYPPRYMSDILRILLHNIQEAKKDILHYGTLDFQNKFLSVANFESKVFDADKDILKVIRTIRFSGSVLGESGAKLVFERIAKDVPNVEVLEMNDCHIGDALQGVGEIMGKLKCLRLSNNKISDKGVEFICQRLENKKVDLDEIDLSGNKLTDKGAQKLVDTLGLESSGKVRELNLCGNKLRGAMVDSLVHFAGIKGMTILADVETQRTISGIARSITKQITKSQDVVISTTATQRAISAPTPDPVTSAPKKTTSLSNQHSAPVVAVVVNRSTDESSPFTSQPVDNAAELFKVGYTYSVTEEDAVEEPPVDQEEPDENEPPMARHAVTQLVPKKQLNQVKSEEEPKAEALPDVKEAPETS